MITVKDYKADFPLLMQDPTIYIDNAATTQRPGCVLDAEREFYEKHNANPLRGIYDLSVAARHTKAQGMLCVILSAHSPLRR